MFPLVLSHQTNAGEDLTFFPLWLLKITHRAFMGKEVTLGLLSIISLLLTLPESTTQAQTFQLMATKAGL